MIFGGEAGLLNSDRQTICNHHLLACLLEIKSILHIALRFFLLDQKADFFL